MKQFVIGLILTEGLYMLGLLYSLQVEYEVWAL